MGDPSDFTLGGGRYRPPARTLRILQRGDPKGIGMMGKDGFVRSVHRLDVAYAKSIGWLAPPKKKKATKK